MKVGVSFEIVLMFLVVVVNGVFWNGEWIVEFYEVGWFVEVMLEIWVRNNYNG